jgi:hypothetical protein
MNAFIQMVAHQLSKVFQKRMCWRCPAVFLSPHTGSLDEVWMLLHQPSIMVKFDCWWSLGGVFAGLWEFFFVIDIYIEFIFGLISWCVCFLHGV